MTRKALIIGGGIAGAATAIFLRRAGYAAEMFESRPQADDIGGGLQVAPNGMHVMAELGLAGAVREAGSCSTGMRFYAQGGGYLGAINRNMETRFGAPAINIRRGALQDILLDEAMRSGAGLHFGKRLTSVDDVPGRPVVARFADGETAEGDILIGADGVHSAVRTWLFPEGPHPFDTGLVGFGGFVPRALLDAAGVGQDMHMTFGRSGFFGYGICGGPNGGDAMWWSTQPETGVDASTFRTMGPRAIKDHLLAFHAGWHAPIPQLIDAAQEFVVTDTLDVATLPLWHRRRVLLIGDAAHATSPHAGQGASLALEDASRLGKLIARHGGDTDIAFAHFENERRGRTERVVALARQNGNSKREFSPTGAFVRDQMMRLLLPLFASRQNWMYAYDARTI